MREIDGNNILNMDDLHKVQLEIGLWVKDICERNNIKYFLIAGTLLGAVRHQGFIPWDDDFDLGMLRADYEKFLEIAQSEVGDKYFIQTICTDNNMPLPYAKVRLNGSVLIEENSEQCEWNNGIFIDIFPFDGSPDSCFLQLIHEYGIKIITAILLYKCKFKFNKNQLLVLFFIKPLSKILPLYFLKKTSIYITTMFSRRSTNYVIASGGSYGYKKERIPLIWLEDQEIIKFCGFDFDCPKSHHHYLANLYGDYMKPPPLDQRHNRHKIKLIKHKESI